MSPREFLDLADEWSAGSREGEWRSAVSRAYYAAFHVARSLFLDCGFSVPQGDQAHGYLWLRLANAGHPDVQRVGNNLNDLRRVRNRADYDLSTSFAQRNSVNYVLAAYDIVRLLEELPTMPATLAQVTTAMRDYERDVLREVTWQL